MADFCFLEIPREKRHRPLGELGVGFSNHHGAADSRDFKKQRLDGLRLNVFATGDDQAAVSYTHLTLPTIYSV